MLSCTQRRLFWAGYGSTSINLFCFCYFSTHFRCFIVPDYSLFFYLFTSPQKYDIHPADIIRHGSITKLPTCSSMQAVSPFPLFLHFRKPYHLQKFHVTIELSSYHFQKEDPDNWWLKPAPDCLKTKLRRMLDTLTFLKEGELMMFKKLPIGIQSFEKLREDNFL